MATFALDMLIRQETNHTKSFDDVLKDMQDRFTGEAAAELTKLSFIASVKRSTGVDISSFVRQYISQSGVLPLRDLMSSVGLCLTESKEDGDWTATMSQCENMTEPEHTQQSAWLSL